MNAPHAGLTRSCPCLPPTGIVVFKVYDSHDYHAGTAWATFVGSALVVANLCFDGYTSATQVSACCVRVCSPSARHARRDHGACGFRTPPPACALPLSVACWHRMAS